MKLHTSLARTDVCAALRAVKADGQMAEDVMFMQLDAEGSRTHERGFKVQLGTYDPGSGPGKSRHFKNSGQYGASRVWAATYDEWGYFIAEVFRRDPGASFGPYKCLADLHAVWTADAARKRAAEAAKRTRERDLKAARARLRAAQAELDRLTS